MLKICQIIVMLCWSFTLPANTISNADIITQATKFVEEEIGKDIPGKVVAKVRAFDTKTPNKICSTPLRFELNTTSRSNSKVVVDIACDTPNWIYHIPVNVKIFRQVAISNRPLARKEIVSAFDFSMQEKDIANLNQGFYEDSADIIGKEVSYAVRTGEIITPKNLTTAKVINRGDFVQISAEMPGLKVSMSGTATESGAVGETIKIKNSSSQRIIEAQITGPSKAKIMLF